MTSSSSRTRTPTTSTATLTPPAPPAFPNARYLIAETEWAYWTQPPGSDANAFDVARRAAQRQLVGLGARLGRVASDAELAPGVRAVPAPGHAPGQLALLIGAGATRDRWLHLADAVHHPMQLGQPDWYLSFDYDGPQAAATRRALFSRAAAAGWLVSAYHFGFPSLGHIRADGDRWRWETL